MFLHATAVEGVKEAAGIAVKWVRASELLVSDDGIVIKNAEFQF